MLSDSEKTKRKFHPNAAKLNRELRNQRNLDENEANKRGKLTGREQSRGFIDGGVDMSSELLLVLGVAEGPERRARLVAGGEDERRHGIVGDEGYLIHRPWMAEVEVEVEVHEHLSHVRRLLRPRWEGWSSGSLFLRFGHFLNLFGVICWRRSDWFPRKSSLLEGKR